MNHCTDVVTAGTTTSASFSALRSFAARKPSWWPPFEFPSAARGGPCLEVQSDYGDEWRSGEELEEDDLEGGAEEEGAMECSDDGDDSSVSTSARGGLIWMPE